MKRFLRSPEPGWSDYAALAVFVLAFATAVAFVVSPGTFVGDPRAQASLAFNP